MSVVASELAIAVQEDVQHSSAVQALSSVPSPPRVHVMSVGLAFTKESVEEVTLALGCCAKRQAKPRRDADADDLTVENGGDSGFVFRVLAMAVAFFGTIFCVQVGAGFLACNHLLLSVSRLAPHLIIANARAVLVVFTIAVVRVGGEHKQRKT